jgi:hypothetical protein
METKYTPGPWEVYCLEKTIMVTTYTRGNICTMELSSQALNNAKLIAVAPSLLAICKISADRFESVAQLLEAGTDKEIIIRKLRRYKKNAMSVFLQATA